MKLRQERLRDGVEACPVWLVFYCLIAGCAVSPSICKAGYGSVWGLMKMSVKINLSEFGMGRQFPRADLSRTHFRLQPEPVGAAIHY